MTVVGETHVRTLMKRGRVYVNFDDLLSHLHSLAQDYKIDGQKTVGTAYEILANDLKEDIRR